MRENKILSLKYHALSLMLFTTAGAIHFVQSLFNPIRMNETISSFLTINSVVLSVTILVVAFCSEIQIYQKASNLRNFRIIILLIDFIITKPPDSSQFGYFILPSQIFINIVVCLIIIHNVQPNANYKLYLQQETKNFRESRPPAYRNFLTNIQSSLECCGYRNMREEYGSNYPNSCCLKEDLERDKRHLDPFCHPDAAFERGCWRVYKEQHQIYKKTLLFYVAFSTVWQAFLIGTIYSTDRSLKHSGPELKSVHSN